MTRPMPFPTPLTEPFWAACRRRELVVQRCEVCAAPAFYPRSTCPRCGGDRLAWQPVTGRGSLYTFTIARRATHRKLVDRVPYVIAVVELDEGPHLTSTVVGTPVDALRIGDRLVVDFEEHEEITIPVFRVDHQAGP